MIFGHKDFMFLRKSVNYCNKGPFMIYRGVKHQREISWVKEIYG